MGCGDPKPPAPKPDLAGLKARQELSAKFKTMTPAERQEYAKAHVGEMAAAMGLSPRKP
jgi:hypothetical protein